MRWLIALLFSCLAATAQAQVNVEPIVSAVTDPGWAFKAGAGFGFASGNTSYTDLSGDSTLQYLTLRPSADPENPGSDFLDRIVFSAKLQRRAYADGKVLDGRFIHARYTRMQHKNVGGEVFGQIGNDRLLIQKWRVLVGAGVRFVLADTEAADVVFGTGYMYEYEDRDIAEDRFDAPIEIDHRSTSYLTLKLFPVPDRVSLLNTVYVQPRWDAPEDIQILNDLSLKVALSDNFALSTGLFLRYDSRPPSELVPLDVRMNNGLSLSF